MRAISKPELALWANADGTGRAYKHPFRKNADNKPLTSPSITTVLKLENKDNLVQWAANLTLEWCIQNWFVLGQRSTEDATKAGRYRWRDVRDERAEVGTGIHETVEAEHTGSWNFPELDDEQKEIMVEWRLLNERYTIRPLLTEFTVWNFTYDFAGTGDGVWEVTDNETGEIFIALIDLKTSRNTWPGHWMQLAALANGEVLMVKNAEGVWHEQPMPEFDKVAIIHLRAAERDADGNVTKEAKHDVLFAKDLDLRWEQFKAYRSIWAAEAELKEREKKEEADKIVGFTD